MTRRIKRSLSILSFRMLIAMCVAITIGLTNSFMMNFSNSPDLKLLISGNLDDIKPDLSGKFRVPLTLENRGATISSSRVKIKVPASDAGAVRVNALDKQLTVGDALMVEKGFEQVSSNSKETVYQRDVEFRVFPGRNYELGTIEVDFSKVKEPRIEYNIVAESMVKRVGFYVFNLNDGRIGIKDGSQWADYGAANVTGWGKFFRFLSGKNIR